MKVVLRAGVEPARPQGTQDFKSCASTNSATPARVEKISMNTNSNPRGLHVHNQWTVDGGQWEAVNGKWEVGSGKWEVICMQRVLQRFED